ncbi:hypothetical protein SH449x_004303 [Pirellulaceae bacterium SH449]
MNERRKKEKALSACKQESDAVIQTSEHASRRRGAGYCTEAIIGQKSLDTMVV